MTRHEYEAIVLGAGPAGCATATLLARRAHRVALVRPATTPAGALAEAVPPSANKLLRELSLLDAVQGAGFQENLGNTVWWALRPPRVEKFAEGERGVHVERRRLEEVLVHAAEVAGVRVYDGFAAYHAREDATGWTVASRGADGDPIELRAPWVVDATGRRGFLARREGREPDRRPATLALLGRFRRPGGWDAEAGHTLIESWADGWAWSVPLDEGLRCFAAMVDRAAVAREGMGKREAMLAAITRATHLGAMVAEAEPAGTVWACSASLYASRQYGRKGLLLAGDAGSFIDPLSSFGVKKALSSGWLAGVVVHTALVDMPATEASVEFFDRREREVYQRYRMLSAEFFQEAASVYATAYWEERVLVANDEGAPATNAQSDPDQVVPELPERDVRGAFELIRSRSSLDAVPGSTLRRVKRAGIEGQRVKMQLHLASDVVPEGIRYVRGVDLPLLVAAAPSHAQVPDAWAAYNGMAAPVTLPDYLTALATAFAAGFLEHAKP